MSDKIPSGYKLSTTCPPRVATILTRSPWPLGAESFVGTRVDRCASGRWIASASFIHEADGLTQYPFFYADNSTDAAAALYGWPEFDAPDPDEIYLGQHVVGVVHFLPFDHVFDDNFSDWLAVH